MTDQTSRARSRIRPMDLLRSGSQGLHTRPGRTMLTAIGIAIGIAAMIGVLGISASSKAALLQQIDDLGTNLLAVQAGQSIFGDQAKLPEDAPSMIRRIPPVEQAAALSSVSASVRKTDLIPATETNGINLFAAETEVLDTLQAKVADGRFLDAAAAEVPSIVLGSVAAERLGITGVDPGQMVYLNGHWFNVIGILEPMPLNPDLDRAAFIGYSVADKLFDTDANASTIYLRTHPDQVDGVRGLLARTANPESPNEVQVSRPSDALEAKATVDQNLTRLLLGLGAVALVVGGVGIANVMVISVLERRSEIGLRRALGARRSHIAGQFVSESIMLSLLGGVTGVALGAAVTYTYANRQGWVVDIPVQALGAGVAVALIVGAIAGLYPAVRAARMDPAEAVHPTG
ncbi:MAG: ABC transporter permease [Acidimicrobiia bacterium]|nr:ABC transporter permease [Acidimicrobiia bacterium]MDX2467582.1 ABC transporter permease [Acidimicrobiia bacterium]